MWKSLKVKVGSEMGIGVPQSCFVNQERVFFAFFLAKYDNGTFLFYWIFMWGFVYRLIDYGLEDQDMGNECGVELDSRKVFGR